MMVRKLAILALLLLYAVTGSVAASAAHDDCAHGPFASAPTQVFVAAPVVGQSHREPSYGAPGSVDGAVHCDGFCHLLSVARLQTVIELPLRTYLRQAQVTGSSVPPSSSKVAVPTPPPNVA